MMKKCMWKNFKIVTKIKIERSEFDVVVNRPKD
jgi:hypothetical protein